MGRIVPLIPCSITSLRIGIGLAFPWLPTEWRLLAVAFAAFTDLIDGPISRWLKVDGFVGQVLDPIADKVCLAGVLITLLLDGSLQWSEMLLVGARDWLLVLAFACLFLQRRNWDWRPMPARWPGKATTVLQTAFVLALLGGSSLAQVLVVPTALLGIVAVAVYFVAFVGAHHHPAGANRTPSK